MSELRKAEVDLSRYNEGPPQKYTTGALGINPPLDMPLYLRVFRLMGDVTGDDGRTVEGLKGWTLQMDAWTFGVTVYLRIGRDGTLKLFAKDGDNPPVKLEEWTK